MPSVVRPPRAFRQKPLAAALSRQSGFGLMETLLVLGAVTAMSVGVYALFFSSDVTAEVKTEQANLNSLSTAVERSFGLTGGFGPVSLAQVSADGLLPRAYSRSGSVQTAWGSSVDIRANAVANPNDSFVIDYANVPAEACSRLASAMAPNLYDLRVGGTSVMDSNGLNPGSAASACSDGARMEFVYFSGLATGAAVATPSLTLPTAPPSVDPANPITPSTPVSGAPSVGDVAAPPPVAVTPGSPVAPPPVAPPSAPAPAPVVAPPGTPAGTQPPPPTLAACTVPAPTSGSQQVACPAGQYGITNQQRVGTYSCPEAWDAPVLTWGAWSTTNSSCAACPAGSTQTNTQWVGTSASCPGGQYGSNTWEREQRQTRSVSYNCPAGTTTLPAPTYGGWSGWSDTGATRNNSNTCTTCPAPQTETQTVGCPAGQTGSITQQRTRTFNCSGAGGWNNWSGWNTTGNTCTTPPPAYQYSINSMATVGGACGLRIEIRSSGGNFTAVGTVTINGRSSDRTFNLGSQTVVSGSSRETYTLTFFQDKNPNVQTNNISETAYTECN